MSGATKITIVSVLLVVIAALSPARCASRKVDIHQGENLMVSKTIEEVLKDHTDQLMSIPGVVGTAQGICNSKPCIKVYVVKKTPELDKKIPKNIQGFPVSIEETGEIRPLLQRRS